VTGKAAVAPPPGMPYIAAFPAAAAPAVLGRVSEQVREQVSRCKGKVKCVCVRVHVWTDAHDDGSLNAAA
jgi:hypothetical protein